MVVEKRRTSVEKGREEEGDMADVYERKRGRMDRVRKELWKMEEVKEEKNEDKEEEIEKIEKYWKKKENDE